MDTLGSILCNGGYSWSPVGKDRDGDGKVSREEFKLPVLPGSGAIVPSDLANAGTFDDAFDAYDHNRDGVIDADELRTGARPQSIAHRSVDLAAMSTEEALAYLLGQAGRAHLDPAAAP